MKRQFLLVTCLWLFALALSVAAYAGEPLDLVKSTVDKALEILQEPRLQAKEKRTEKLNLLRDTVNPVFDYGEMARRTLGKHWAGRSKAEQEEFIKLFRNFVERVYTDKVELYNGERVVFGRETIDRDLAQVESFVVDAKGEKSSVVYRLLKNQSGWKLYDAVVEDISIIANYRSQFDRIIRNSSYQELIRRLSEKTN
ncbi:MAG: ABC transporter substrate-binding protein [Deltaproteobacteria bacterium]|nr:ABC transporter substrate-binding protein [Deltaproteobacteria bacterium]